MVVISVVRNRSSLALGNVVGSTIANILGAFSLGLIFYKKSSNNQILFEKSSIIYSIALLVVTILASGLLAFGHRIDWRATGGAFIGLFAVYLVSVSYLIAKGITKAPEGSDTSSDSADSDDDDDDNVTNRAEDDDQREPERLRSNEHELSNSAAPGVSNEADGTVEDFFQDNLRTSASRRRSGASDDANKVSGVSIAQGSFGSEVAPVPAVAETPESTSRSVRRRQGASRRHLPERNSSQSPTTADQPVVSRYKQPRGVAYHFVMLGIGFLAIVLSGYVLSNAASNLVDEFGISDVLAGVVILSIATTIPEKFVAVLSGYKGHMDIMLANTVGSNIFLLTLCIGIVWVTTNGVYDGGDVMPAEIGVMFGSTVALALTVLLQGRFARIIGFALLSSYIAFIVLEFTVIHKV